MTTAPQNTNMVDGETVLGVGRAVAGFVPVVGQGIDVALAPVQGAYQTARERKEMSQQLGIRDITKERHSLSAKKFVDKTSGNWLKLTTTAAGGLVGGVGLGLLLGMITGPLGLVLGFVGLIAGGFAGSMAASWAYDKAFTVPNEDSIMLVQQLRDMQQNGQPVAPEMVFAALAANIKGSQGKRLEKELKKRTGTSDFFQALQQGKGASLQDMMAANDTIIRADTGMLVDPRNPLKTASEQLTDWINSGQLDAGRLVVQRDLPIQSLEQTMQQNMQMQNYSPPSTGVEVPMLPPNMRAAKNPFIS